MRAHYTRWVPHTHLLNGQVDEPLLAF